MTDTYPQRRDVKKRIKLSLIPEVIELLETWRSEYSDVANETYDHIIKELIEYQADASGTKKSFLLLSKKEENLLQLAISSLTFYDY